MRGTAIEGVKDLGRITGMDVPCPSRLSNSWIFDLIAKFQLEVFQSVEPQAVGGRTRLLALDTFLDRGGAIAKRFHEGVHMHTLVDDNENYLVAGNQLRQLIVVIQSIVTNYRLCLFVLPSANSNMLSPSPSVAISERPPSAVMFLNPPFRSRSGSSKKISASHCSSGHPQLS